MSCAARYSGDAVKNQGTEIMGVFFNSPVAVADHLKAMSMRSAARSMILSDSINSISTAGCNLRNDGKCRASTLCPHDTGAVNRKLPVSSDFSARTRSSPPAISFKALCA